MSATFKRIHGEPEQIDWRKAIESRALLGEDFDDADDDFNGTPEDVVAVLGFDPVEEEECGCEPVEADELSRKEALFTLDAAAQRALDAVGVGRKADP